VKLGGGELTTKEKTCKGREENTVLDEREPSVLELAELDRIGLCFEKARLPRRDQYEHAERAEEGDISISSYVLLYESNALVEALQDGEKVRVRDRERRGGEVSADPIELCSSNQSNEAILQEFTLAIGAIGMDKRAGADR
jgi:hypothetical protein